MGSVGGWGHGGARLPAGMGVLVSAGMRWARAEHPVPVEAAWSTRLAGISPPLSSSGQPKSTPREIPRLPKPGCSGHDRNSLYIRVLLSLKSFLLLPEVPRANQSGKEGSSWTALPVPKGTPQGSCAQSCCSSKLRAQRWDNKSSQKSLGTKGRERRRR